MLRCRKTVLCSLTCLVAALALATAGCGRSGGEAQSNTASIANPSDPAQAGKETAAGGSKATRDPLHPMVVVETSLGKITLALDAEKAPLTVKNFVEHANNGFYDQTIFHQVFQGQGVLGGGYTADLNEKATSSSGIRNEADNGLKNRRGTIAMVRYPDVIDSARSQFFLNVADNEILDHKDRTPEGYGYCVFGKVTDGEEVLDKIATVSVEDVPKFERKPVKTVLIKSVRLVR
jgi:cyclophilin family peptidyl-prolyl cis-trans isomerase